MLANIRDTCINHHDKTSALSSTQSQELQDNLQLDDWNERDRLQLVSWNGKILWHDLQLDDCKGLCKLFLSTLVTHHHSWKFDTCCNLLA